MKSEYIKHKIANLISINKIVTIHYYELDKTFFFEGESHNFWELVYVDAGEVEINANKNTYFLGQGEIIFHKPNEFHTLKANKNAPANVFVLSFVCSSEAMKLFKDKTLHLPPKLKRYIAAIIDEYNQTFDKMNFKDMELKLRENARIGGQQMIRTHLEQLLIMLIRAQQEKRQETIFPSKESMENHLTLQMMHIIEEKVYSRITVEEICATLNYSRTYLSKIFKLHSGHTISEYITMLKIQEAKKLIRQERYTFTEISDMLAFDNPHYFSSVFKRKTNMTPSEYKNSVQTI